jgi:hypothetical protein
MEQQSATTFKKTAINNHSLLVAGFHERTKAFLDFYWKSLFVDQILVRKAIDISRILTIFIPGS